MLPIQININQRCRLLRLNHRFYIRQYRAYSSTAVGIQTAQTQEEEQKENSENGAEKSEVKTGRKSPKRQLQQNPTEQDQKEQYIFWPRPPPMRRRSNLRARAAAVEQHQLARQEQIITVPKQQQQNVQSNFQSVKPIASFSPPTGANLMKDQQQLIAQLIQRVQPQLRQIWAVSTAKANIPSLSIARPSVAPLNPENNLQELLKLLLQRQQTQAAQKTKSSPTPNNPTSISSALTPVNEEQQLFALLNQFRAQMAQMGAASLLNTLQQQNTRISPPVAPQVVVVKQPQPQPPMTNNTSSILQTKLISELLLKQQKEINSQKRAQQTTTELINGLLAALLSLEDKEKGQQQAQNTEQPNAAIVQKNLELLQQAVLQAKSTTQNQTKQEIMGNKQSEQLKYTPLPEVLQEQPKIIVPSEQKQLKIVENGKREKLPNEKQTDGTSAASIPKANESVQTEEVVIAVDLEELEEESPSRPRFQSLLKNTGADQTPISQESSQKSPANEQLKALTERLARQEAQLRLLQRKTMLQQQRVLRAPQFPAHQQPMFQNFGGPEVQSYRGPAAGRAQSHYQQLAHQNQERLNQEALEYALKMQKGSTPENAAATDDNKTGDNAADWWILDKNRPKQKHTQKVDAKQSDVDTAKEVFWEEESTELAKQPQESPVDRVVEKPSSAAASEKQKQQKVPPSKPQLGNLFLSGSMPK